MHYVYVYAAGFEMTFALNMLTNYEPKMTPEAGTENWNSLNLLEY